MKFSCYKKDLADALKLVSKAVATKPQTPILSGIFLKAQSNKLELQANDFSLGITAKIPAYVEVEGAVVVSGKRIADFVKVMPDNTISFSNEDNQNQLAIFSGGAQVDLLTMNAEDFPQVKAPDTDSSFAIPSSAFGKLINKTVYAVSEDESRPVFTGVKFELKPNKISLVATNTHRLALASEPIDNHNDSAFVVPANSLNAILPMLNAESDDKFVFVNYSEKQISFTFDNFFVTSRLVEGVFPPYDKVIPAETSIHVQVDAAEFKAAVKFVSLMSQEDDYNTTRFHFGKDGIEISANSQAAGSAEKVVEAQIEGGELTIAFNSAYLVDWLNSVASKIIKLDLNGQIELAKLTELDDDNFIYVVTPLRA